MYQRRLATVAAGVRLLVFGSTDGMVFNQPVNVPFR